MAPTGKRKTGIFGMSDLKKPTQKKQKTGIFGMSDLKKKTKDADAKSPTGSRRLRDLIATELPADDGLMDDLLLDHTLGVLDDRVSGDEASEDGSYASVDAGGDEPDDQGSDEEDDADPNVSEAEEVGTSDEETDDDSVEEEEVIKAAKAELHKNNERALFEHNQMLERVEADNQFTANMTDEELSSHVLPEEGGGRFELVSIREGEEVPASERVTPVELASGVLYNAATREVYRPTNLVDSKTGKVLKTVRRHPKGPPEGPTYSVTKVPAKKANELAAEAKTHVPQAHA